MSVYLTEDFPLVDSGSLPTLYDFETAVCNSPR
jgi:hypothetical protein